MRVAFYAPLKHPGHPTPSGDRAMARLLIEALRHAGHQVDTASALRSYSASPDAGRLEMLRRDSDTEAQALLTAWRGESAVLRPDVWMTYHPYYKAPDLLGPEVARGLAIPYVAAEASHAGKRDRDDWRAWQQAVAAALLASEAVFCFTQRDASGLAAFFGEKDRLIDLPPFIDTRPFAVLPAAGSPRAGGRVELVAAAMMRPGVKTDSYAFLAQALGRLSGLDWRLTIIGDGPARAAVADAFAGLDAARCRWLGAIPKDDMPAHLAAADIYVWPGFGEAYGMAYLEAQAAGLPVVALACGGVASTLQPGRTGLLVPEGDLDGYADAVGSLIRDGDRRRRMGRAARLFVTSERSLQQGAVILDRGLAAACRRYRARNGHAVA